MSARIRNWHVKRSTRRVAGFHRIVNSTREIGVCYGTREEAELMAAAPKLLGALKHLTAIVRLRTDLRASERAKYEAAVKLLAEVSP